jgi:hypothetical protein
MPKTAPWQSLEAVGKHQGGRTMSEWNELMHWMYGEGFWYAKPLWAIHKLTEDELLWIPEPNSLCMLWHVGHIAHRERFHIAKFLQGLEGEIIPPQYEIFGPDWVSVDEIKKSIDSVPAVLEWVADVRKETHRYIDSLTDDDLHTVPPTSDLGLSIAHWLFITVSHGAVHIGKIQLLRAMLEGKRDRAC